MLSMVREIVFGVGFALLLPLFFGLDGVLYSMPVSDILTAIIFAIPICDLVDTIVESATGLVVAVAIELFTFKDEL